MYNWIIFLYTYYATLLINYISIKYVKLQGTHTLNKIQIIEIIENIFSDQNWIKLEANARKLVKSSQIFRDER